MLPLAAKWLHDENAVGTQVEPPAERYGHIKVISPSDQVRTVYAWEDVMFPDSLGAAYLSLQDCQLFVDEIWTHLGLDQRMKSPIVSDGRGSKCARSWGDRIMLPRWARNFTVLIHELAHCITDIIDPVDNLEHGPIYVYVYITLLARYCEHNHSSLLKSARNSGILVQPVKLKSRLKHQVEVSL